MADVAALSVVSSGVVGIFGALAGFYGQRVALSNETARRRDARRHDLRDVLDDAATVALGVAAPGRLYDLSAGEIGAWFEQIAEAMSAPHARLGVRVGPVADIYVAYDALRITTADASLTFRALPPDMTFEELLTSEVPGAASARDVSASLTADTHRFLEAAAATVESDA